MLKSMNMSNLNTRLGYLEHKMDVSDFFSLNCLMKHQCDVVHLIARPHSIAFIEGALISCFYLFRIDI